MRHAPRLAALLFAALSAAGCTVGPDFVHQAPPHPHRERVVLAGFQRGHEQDVAAGLRQPRGTRDQVGRGHRAEAGAERDGPHRAGEDDTSLPRISLHIAGSMVRDGHEPVAQRQGGVEPGAEQRGRVARAPFRVPRRDQVVEQHRERQAAAPPGLRGPVWEARHGPWCAEHQEVVAGPDVRTFTRHGRGGHRHDRARDGPPGAQRGLPLAQRLALQHGGAQQRLPQGGWQQVDHPLGLPPRGKARVGCRCELRGRQGGRPLERGLDGRPGNFGQGRPGAAPDEPQARGERTQRPGDFEGEALDAAGPGVEAEIMEQVLDIDPDRRVSAGPHHRLDAAGARWPPGGAGTSTPSGPRPPPTPPAPPPAGRRARGRGCTKRSPGPPPRRRRWRPGRRRARRRCPS